MARPEKFKPEYPGMAKKACQLGATDMDLAEMFDVSLRTISYWRINNPEFAESLRLGKEAADERVERSLYARAMGYEHDEIDIRVIKDEIVQTPIRKYYPPDATSAIFWLKNRQSAKWRDIKAVEMSGPDGAPISVAQLNDEQLLAIAAKAK